MAKGANRGGSYWEKKSGKAGMQKDNQPKPTHEAKLERAITFLMGQGYSRQQAIEEARKMRV